MRVQIAEHANTPQSQTRADRIPFKQVLSTSTVLFITCPLNASTRNLLTLPLLRLLPKNALVINVARGGIVNEEDLLIALREESIGGVGSDVFVKEPCGWEDNVLVKAAREDMNDEESAERKDGEGALNLLLTPHLAWYAQSSVDKLGRVTIENCVAWVEGKPENVVCI